MKAPPTHVCSVCGNNKFLRNYVLWPELINEWQLSPKEAGYLDRQQGEFCANCGSTLRAIVLVKALLSVLQYNDTLLQYVKHPPSLMLLEINKAVNLTKYLSQFTNYNFVEYPSVDIHDLPYSDNTFDILIHSDTLEHVDNPFHALAECLRILKPGGALCYTVPTLAGRMTRSRAGLPLSYHGQEAEQIDYIVKTEFGADMWTYPILAGFSSVTIHTFDFPTAIAMVATK